MPNTTRPMFAQYAVPAHMQHGFGVVDRVYVTLLH
jgi:hypothetical protein